MSNNKSQVEVIKEKLVKDGKVSNLWALTAFINLFINQNKLTEL